MNVNNGKRVEKEEKNASRIFAVANEKSDKSDCDLLMIREYIACA